MTYKSIRPLYSWSNSDYAWCMPAGWDIPRIRCFSLSDLHDFDRCPFLFYVKHHLGKKYEIEESNSKRALGVLLDEAIKRFHNSHSYGAELDYLANLTVAAYNALRQDSKPFTAIHRPFLTQEVLDEAIATFQDYYRSLEGKIKQSPGQVGFCKVVIASDSGDLVVWGSPDTFEQGEDGIVEICDYKYHEDPQKGKAYLDMDLMPKIYTLLSIKRLREMGIRSDNFRFCVRLWQEPGNDSLYEEFSISTLPMIESLCRQKIARILSTSEFRCCEKSWCQACQSTDRLIYLQQLKAMDLRLLESADEGATWYQLDRPDPAA